MKRHETTKSISSLLRKRLSIRQDRPTLENMFQINKKLSFKSKRIDILSLYREKSKEQRVQFMRQLDKEQREQLIFELDIDLKQQQVR